MPALCPQTTRLGKRPSRSGRSRSPAIDAFRGKLADSARTLAACLQFDSAFRPGRRAAGNLRLSENGRRHGQQPVSADARPLSACRQPGGQAASFIRPEIMAIKSPPRWRSFWPTKELAEFRLLARADAALQAAHAGAKRAKNCWPCRAKWPEASNQIFRQLSDADLKWGAGQERTGRAGRAEQRPRSRPFCTRRSAASASRPFIKYYEQYQAHENTLAATLGGSVQRDVYYAKARGYPSALRAALFHDNMPLAVYDNLIASVHRHLPALYRYYELRRRKMQLTDDPSLRHLRADPQRAGERGTPGARRSSW